MIFSYICRSFAESIFGKLSQMIEGLSTPYETKLKLIPIFQHVHHDPVKTSQVCVRLFSVTNAISMSASVSKRLSTI